MLRMKTIYKEKNYLIFISLKTFDFYFICMQIYLYLFISHACLITAEARRGYKLP